MANTFLEALLALTRQGLKSDDLEIYIFLKLCLLLFPPYLHTVAELFASDFGSVDGEANVLVQAIMSMKSIIKQDPLSHEKVYFFSDFYVDLFLFLMEFTVIIFSWLIVKASVHC